MRRILGALALFFVSIATAYGQDARWDGVVLAPTGMPVAGAYVRVCTQPASGSPCSPLASLYSDALGTIPAANPVTTDTNGNAFFYTEGGLYTIEFYGQGLVDKQVPDQTITLPLGSTATFTTITLTTSLILDGSTSGTITLLAPAVAGTNTAVFPAATGNVLLDSAAQTISSKIFAQNLIPDTTGRTVGTAAFPYSSIYLGGVATNNINLTGAATAARTATLPDNTGTLAELNLPQTWSATQTFPSASLPPGVLVAGTVGQCVITTGGVAAWGACTGTPGANTALSNLTGVAINTTLVPATAASSNLGTALLPWGDLFIGGSASHALDFGVSLLSTNRTIGFPDNSGLIAELNLAQAWTAAQTFTQQISSSLATGTAPFSIISTTLVPNLNVNVLGGITVTGTPSAGQSLVATSSSAAGWGIPSTVGIQTYCSTTLSGGVALSANTLTPVQTLACTAPATGCPCRAQVSYTYYWSVTSGAGPNILDVRVSDGTSFFAGSESNASTSAATTSNVKTEWSPNRYSNSQSITFSVSAEGTPTLSINQFSGIITSLASQIQAVIFTSN